MLRSGRPARTLALVGTSLIMLGGAACTVAIDGSPTAAPVPIKSTEGETVSAPEESYIYESGTAVTINEVAKDDEMGGLLSDEYGRIISFEVANDSDLTIDLSDTRSDAEVDCDDKTQYVFPSKSLGGPEELAAGEKSSYTLHFGLEKVLVGSTCVIVIPLDSDDGQLSDATFEMVID